MYWRPWWLLRCHHWADFNSTDKTKRWWLLCAIHCKAICIASRQSVNAGLHLWNISGAVMANKKLSVILNRDKNTEGVKRQWQGVGECLVLSVMDSLSEGGIFTTKKLWWAGCGGPKSFMQEPYVMYILIKQSKHMIKMADMLYYICSFCEIRWCRRKIWAFFCFFIKYIYVYIKKEWF